MTDELTVTPAPWMATAIDPTSPTHMGAEAAVWGPDGDMVALVWGNLGEDSDALTTALWIAEQRNCGTADEAKYREQARELAVALDVLTKHSENGYAFAEAFAALAHAREAHLLPAEEEAHGH